MSLGKQTLTTGRTIVLMSDFVNKKHVYKKPRAVGEYPSLSSSLASYKVTLDTWPSYYYSGVYTRLFYTATFSIEALVPGMRSPDLRPTIQYGVHKEYFVDHHLYKRVA